MEYLDLLQSSLKCDVLLDLFETYDVEVVYSYDRNHENMEDEYTAEIPEMGLGFVFDSSQRLTTLFMRNVEHTGFNPFTGNDPRNVPFQNGAAAIKWASENSIDAEHREAQTDDVFGEIPEWIKLNFETFYLHYQFNDGTIDKVTMQVQDA